MNEGERRFYLREVYPYWSKPRIPKEKVAELEEAKLIERDTNLIAMIRLTREGAREKTTSRMRKTESTLSLTRTPERAPRRARRAVRGTLPRRLS
jgi:hypothetical protein